MVRYPGILALVVACGGDTAGVDAGAPDAAWVAPWGRCDPDFSDAYIATAFQILDLGQGRDLDEDGDIDNAIGLFAGPLTNGINNTIANGATLVTVVPQLEQLYMPAASDADDDPSNNLTGGGIAVNDNAFDVECRPRGAVPITVAAGAFEGGGPSMSFLTSPAGDVLLKRVLVAGDVGLDGSVSSVDLFGAWTACGMDRVSFPGVTGDPTLIVPALRIVVVSVGMQPDIDVDGDGLERFEVDPETFVVLRCTDGDGTVLEHETCACDPRIADGYSAAAHVELVPANIVWTY